MDHISMWDEFFDLTFDNCLGKPYFLNFWIYKFLDFFQTSLYNMTFQFKSQEVCITKYFDNEAIAFEWLVLPLHIYFHYTIIYSDSRSDLYNVPHTILAI